MRCIFKDPRLMYKIFNTFKNHIISIAIEFTEDGIKADALDTAHTTMVIIRLGRDSFTKYEWQRPVVVNVDVKTLLKVLKIATGDHVLGFSCEDDDPTLLNVQFALPGTDDVFDFDIKLMMLDEEGLTPEFDISNSWEVIIDSEVFKKKLNSCKEFGDEIMVGASNNGILYMKVEGDTANAMTSTGAKVRWVGDEGTEKQIIQKVSLLYLSEYCGSSTMSQSVCVVIKDDTPMRFTYQLSEQSFVSYFIAPKVED
jgi:proliferating cell nuclear antigen